MMFDLGGIKEAQSSLIVGWGELSIGSLDQVRLNASSKELRSVSLDISRPPYTSLPKTTLSNTSFLKVFHIYNFFHHHVLICC